MDIEKEIIDKYELSTEAVTAIQGAVKTHYDDHISTLKGEWDSKANDGAQAIVDDIIKGTQKATGFAMDRNQGEKSAPFLLRYTAAYLTDQKTGLEQSKLDYDNKLKDFKGDESLKTDYDALKITHSDLQKKEADFDALTSAGFEGKYNELFTESETMREDIAFGTAKPSFNKDANAYEVAAVWNKFIEETKSTHNIVVVDRVGMAVDKTNEHKIFPLTDLVKGNEELTKLIDGRQQKGIDGKEIDYTDVKNVPFKVPKDADTATLAALVQAQLTKDGVKPTDLDSSKKFQEMYDLAKAG
jgi:hypothetical protein